MRQAAVGFQCPTCVAEGAKATRSGRTAYGGLRPTNASLTSSVLIGINVAVWIAVLATGGAASRLISILGLRPTGICFVRGGTDQYWPSAVESTCGTSRFEFGEWVPGVADGALWQLLTSTFVHAEVWHIGFNMLALWILGPQLEMAIGRARFLTLYLGSGLAGSAMVFWLSGTGTLTAGASGSIFGLLAALLVLAWRVRGNVQPILLWVGLNVVITVTGREFISWQGHLGGFLGGLALMGLFVLAPRERRTTWQVAGTVLLGLLLVAAIVARSLTLP
ncbi:rhomboid family protein [Nocardioides donggukensis]|uniref:Rhomboid family intramembrane serine protease n=1 Tax=Nocardioides donggukensis TaxID=2774019 RepID=A0A927PYW8_9ACTN|nr:rhomboid family intramembrane serine protease [Nocardioides donggukensis]MBD8868005.1 rhomboid family intramembrane serine protease [Nocardioides donggukensis]